MRFTSKLQATLLCAASVVALSSTARAQDAAAPETVVVTGSRVITNSANSPTPITAISTDQLKATSAIDIPDALNQLPIFAGSVTPQDTGNAANGARGNALNLRNFGAVRTLVLFDGHRQPPSSSAGTVDIDTLPQMLVSRVDIVTGGGSAVYGSDAVTGVVNFVLNTHFSGIKIDTNAGISSFSDGAEQQFAIAAGTDLFGGRGHIEGSFRYYHEDPILLSARSWGPANSWVVEGAGTAASPLVNYNHGTQASFAYGGKITCTGCAANNTQFTDNGVIGPFTNGGATGATNILAGGDGGTNLAATLQTSTISYQNFGRFNYAIDNDTTFYIQGLFSQATTTGYHVVNYVQTGTNPNQVFVNNPFLSPTAQALLANPSGKFTDTQYFLFPHYQANLDININRNMGASAGLDGTIFGRFDWDLFASHYEDRQKVDSPYDESNVKIAAAMDAVVNPANGQIVCQVSLTQYASLYPGCVPLNRFGPTAATTSMYNYILTNSYSVTSTKQDDFSGSISGEVFDLPAGPIKAALNGEYRILSYGVNANGIPGTADCTGLRLCVTGMAQTQHGITLSEPAVSENVWEFAGELDAPLLKDLPFVQSLNLNLAGRYTDYSISGVAETWKIGLDYHVNDDIHFRATTSVDIRAPTLANMFAPATLSHSGFADLHTGNIALQVTNQSGGNPTLVPEVSRTYTAGVVLTPSFIPGLTFSADAYQIVLKNAISSINGATPGVQQICEASHGTSPLCALFIRPLPFADTTPANYPTVVLSETLNAALNDTSGVDFELDYGFGLGDVWDGAPGTVTLRTFADYQPNNNTASFPGAPTTVLPEPHGRLTGIFSYGIGNWDFDFTDRFLTKYLRSSQPGVLFYQQAYAKALNYMDLNIDKKVVVDDTSLDVYFNIKDLLNSAPPIEPYGSTVPGGSPNGEHSDQGNITVVGVDNVGRYFTLGIRANL